MSDRISPKARSRSTATIRDEDTKPLVWFSHLLCARRYRYRKNTSHIPGHPDLWIARYRTAIFVHRCFWHRHPGCRFVFTPSSNVDFWNARFQRTVQQDREVQRQLQDQGIRVLRVWECTIRSMMNTPQVHVEILDRVEAFLHSEEPFLEL